jgi:CBS-domain-containing membrane protein
VNNKISVIRDVVIPLGHYPQINENQTLREAIQTFMAFRDGTQERLRYAGLLVVNDQNQLVGRLSLIDIMQGLVPHLVDATKVKKFEGKDTEYPNLAFLYEEKTFAECGENQQKSVKGLLQAIDFSLPADTHILKALVMMSHRNDFNVPVTENGNIVGLLCLEELFNAMCNIYCDME